MYSTTHSHHLSLHEESSLKNIKPEHKILLTFLIVISIAFSDVESLFQITSHILIVFSIVFISKIPLKTYLKRLTIDIPFILFALFLITAFPNLFVVIYPTAIEPFSVLSSNI